MSIYVFYTLYVYCFTCVCVMYTDKKYLFHTQNLKHQYATLHQLTHASELKTESGGHLWIFPQPVWVFHRSHDLMVRDSIVLYILYLYYKYNIHSYSVFSINHVLKLTIFCTVRMNPSLQENHVIWLWLTRIKINSEWYLKILSVMQGG